jgi:LuxR family maltose regulon positive regulatory protein
MILQTLVLDASGENDQAAQLLSAALRLAAPEGFIRIFVDEGAPMAKLLSRMKAEGGRMKAYISKILTVLGEKEVQTLGIAPQPLIESLSERELEILRLIAQGFSNQEISERLHLALSTVKGHNRNIFGKLQVKRRTEAVVRARELELL